MKVYGPSTIKSTRKKNVNSLPVNNCVNNSEIVASSVNVVSISPEARTPNSLLKSLSKDSDFKSKTRLLTEKLKKSAKLNDAEKVNPTEIIGKGASDIKSNQCSARKNLMVELSNAPSHSRASKDESTISKKTVCPQSFHSGNKSKAVQKATSEGIIDVQKVVRKSTRPRK